MGGEGWKQETRLVKCSEVLKLGVGKKISTLFFFTFGCLKTSLIKEGVYKQANNKLKCKSSYKLSPHPPLMAAASWKRERELRKAVRQMVSPVLMLWIIIKTAVTTWAGSKTRPLPSLNKILFSLIICPLFRATLQFSVHPLYCRLCSITRHHGRMKAPTSWRDTVRPVTISLQGILGCLSWASPQHPQGLMGKLETRHQKKVPSNRKALTKHREG